MKRKTKKITQRRRKKLRLRSWGLRSQWLRRYGQGNLPFTFCRKWFAMQKKKSAILNQVQVRIPIVKRKR